MGLRCCHSKNWDGILMVAESCCWGRRQTANILLSLELNLKKQPSISELPFGHYSQKDKKIVWRHCSKIHWTWGSSSVLSPMGLWSFQGAGVPVRDPSAKGADPQLQTGPTSTPSQGAAGPRDVVCFICTQGHLCLFSFLGK